MGQRAIQVGRGSQPLINTKRLPPGTIVSPVPSDELFASLPLGMFFDLVFLDGLHERHQTYRDLMNALAVLALGGINSRGRRRRAWSVVCRCV